MLKRYIGDKSFYKRVFLLAIPMIIQNTITNFVSLLDNIMVGQLGTAQMSGVSIVNQLIFIFNLAIFGISAGAGVFTAQFHGAKDVNGVRHTMRYRLMASVVVTGIFLAVLSLFQEPLIQLFLQGEGSAEEAAQFLSYGKDYLFVMFFGLLPFAISGAYSGTLRESGQTFVPMVAGTTAVFVNLGLNYILIFGHLGLPAMGVQGAAIATVLSRYVEMAIVILWTHLHPKRNPFVKGLFRSLYIPVALLKKLVLKGLPLLCNEVLWSFAITFMTQRYSVRGLDVVSALNITSTINNLSNVVTLTLGSVTGILLGQMMGAGHSVRAVRAESRKLIALSFCAGILFGGLLICISGLYPELYNVSDGIRQMAGSMIFIIALFKPVMGLVHSCYNTIRAGGKTWMTFINDSGFMWCVSVPLAFCLTQFTNLPILPIYFICQTPEILKLCMSYFILRTDAWMQNLTK